LKSIRRLLRRLSLEKLLVGLNAGLLVFAVTLIAFVSANRLRSMAQEQAEARAGLAGASALQAVSRSEDEVLTASRLLAERPTLKRILESGDSRAAVPFLEQFIATSRLSGGAIFLNGELFASVGALLPWQKLLAEQAPQGGRILSRPQSGALVLAASTPLRGNENGVVVVGRVVDAEFVREISKFAGSDCSIRPVEEALAVESPAQHVRRRAVEWEEQVIELIPDEKRFLAVLPLRNPSGKIVGVVESSLPEEAMTQPLHRFMTSLAFLAFAVAVFGAAASGALARRLVKPLERLRLAAERIGRGDFDTPIPRAPGREIGILAATLEDMRARLLNLTAELRRKQSEAEAVLLGIAEGVYSVDSERRIRYLNPQAAALLGVNAPSAIGRFCGDVLHPRLENGRRPCEDRCPIVHARFRGSATATEHLETAHGPRTVVITSGAATVDSAREGWMGKAQQFQIIRDETDVESARRMRDGVLANISHEFRTPLSAQLASLELLRDRLPDMEVSEARELLLSIERGTLRLTGLIDNLLESVRIDAGMDSIRKQTVALDEIVEEAVDLAAPLIAIREQALDVNLPYPMQPVQGDHSRLVQVFVNLLGNANKFAPAGSTIRIGGETQEKEITLWVEDEGEGIAPGESDAVFERFMRSTGEEPVESGMGLGLWIVKSIVERHGGRVAAEAPDHSGARIRVTLPIGVAESGKLEQESS
jgi:signal transduction histidine kinase